MKRLLLLSNSTNFGEPFLQHPITDDSAVLGLRCFGGALRALCWSPHLLFGLCCPRSRPVPRNRDRCHLGARNWRIRQRLSKTAGAIVVGGGNTFCLLDRLYKHGLLELIRKRVLEGVPYVGWSAGSNVACPTIRTTNDMPIVEPPSLNALGLIPFQINPHYTDATLPNHGGETRAERLAEFLEMNPGMTVIGLQEGSMLKVEGDGIELLGTKAAKVFRKGPGSGRVCSRRFVAVSD